MAKKPTPAKSEGPMQRGDTGRTPRAVYAELRTRFDDPGATATRGFGSDALKVEGKIFAALSHDKLLLKLSRQRVADLIACEIGERFSSGGREMKDWVLASGAVEHWPALALEAREFVAGGQRSAKR